MKFKKSLLATSLSLLAATASAGHFSTEVSENQYTTQLDYVVNVVNGYGVSCGGQLVSERYVITAAHCLQQDPDGELDVSLITSSPNDHTTITFDASQANVKVHVGNRNRHEAQEIKVTNIVISPDYIYDDSPNNLWVKAQANADEQNSETASFYGDLAILTLESAYKAQNAAVINTFELTSDVDTSTPAEIIKPEAHIYGWGKTETGDSPAVLRDTTMFYDVTTHWGDDNLTETNYSDFDIETFVQNSNGSNTGSGDSGSPIHIDGKVVSWVSGGGTTRTNGSGSAYHIEWFKSQINDINTVGQKSFSFENSTSESKSWVIPVQNLTVSDVTFTPSLEDDSGLFNITESTCEGTFSSGEACTITVAFNENSSEVTESIESKLLLNDNMSIPLSALKTTTTPPEPVTNPEPASESKSSGGSLGFSILALALLGLRRKSL